VQIVLERAFWKHCSGKSFKWPIVGSTLDRWRTRKWWRERTWTLRKHGQQWSQMGRLLEVRTQELPQMYLLGNLMTKFVFEGMLWILTIILIIESIEINNYHCQWNVNIFIYNILILPLAPCEYGQCLLVSVLMYCI